MIDAVALYRAFLRERLASYPGDDPAYPLASNVYVAPPGLPDAFPGDRRAVVIQLIPGQLLPTAQVANLRFYVRTYGRAGAVGTPAGDVRNSGRDAVMVANFIYKLSYSLQGNRWRLRHGHHINPDPAGIGQYFAKWIAYDSYPVPDNDEDERPYGFMVATVRADLFRGE